MVTEIDRISETTKFNELYLLKGDKDNGTTNMYVEDYRMLDKKNDEVSIANGGPSYKWNYVGTQNLYVVSDSVTSAKVNAPVSANVIRQNDDITPYLNDVPDNLKTGNKVMINKTLDSDADTPGQHLQRNGSTDVVEAG